MDDLTSERLDELAAQLDEHYRDHPERNDLLTWLPAHTFAHLIAMAKRTEQAECERDALRDVLRLLRDVLRLIAEREPMCDYDWAPCDAARAALAQSTDAGGDDEPLLQAEWKPTTRKVRMRLNHLPAEVLHPTPLDWPSDDARGVE